METKFEYNKEVILSKESNPKDIISEMDRIGEYGWEIFSLTEETEYNERLYGDIEKITRYILYMKRKIN